LINSDVRPIVVFDGNKLTMKEGVEDDRHRNRMEAKRKAEEFMR
jgi:5'-3' exonuclease